MTLVTVLCFELRTTGFMDTMTKSSVTSYKGLKVRRLVQPHSCINLILIPGEALHVSQQALVLRVI